VPGWNNALIQDKAAHTTTPLNITVTSEYKEAKGTYDIEVTVRYTEAVTGKHALHLFLTESKIIDVQELSEGIYKDDYEFNHILRKYITPVATGRSIETGADLKEKGRVYIYRNSLKIDKDDVAQSYWKPENMKVIAFVTDMSAADKHIMHVMETELK
ncbi:MAG: Omp28-related outer membrane protein, partial [Sphingobacteriales bacterium]